MSTASPASEAVKTTLENNVAYFLADKLQDAATPIATKKYLTPDNVLVYLTQCNVAETSVPRIKVQLFVRVDGGVRETGYQLFGDHTFKKYVNEMIFGTAPNTASGNQYDDVTEGEAAQLIEQIGALTQARQTL